MWSCACVICLVVLAKERDREPHTHTHTLFTHTRTRLPLALHSFAVSWYLLGHGQEAELYAVACLGFDCCSKPLDRCSPRQWVCCTRPSHFVPLQPRPHRHPHTTRPSSMLHAALSLDELSAQIGISSSDLLSVVCSSNSLD